MPPAENTPDFDSMSPEELMAWMETLAERQGASEGFTTDKRVEIDEVDPDSVEDSGPGYIPYGMTEEQWAEKQAEEDAARAARRAAAQSSQPAPVEPSPELPVADSEEFDLPDSAEIESEILEDVSEEFTLPQLGTDLEATTDIGPAEDGVEGMAWLESLAAEQAGDFPQMDLSELGQELEGLEIEDTEEPQSEANPMEWLDGLMQEQGEAFDLPTSDDDQFRAVEEAEPSLSEQPPAAQPPARSAEEADPMEWLESLAREEGASTEEFITGAGLEIPAEDEGVADLPAVEPIAEESDPLATRELPDFDAVDELDREDVTDSDDPVAWLDSLAAAQSPEVSYAADDEEVAEEESEEVAALAADQPPVADDEIVEKLNAAQDISPEEMKDWMDNLLEKGAVRTDVSDYIDEEEDDEVLEAQIPDWLVEQVGPPPDLTGDAARTEEDIAPDFDQLPEMDETAEEDIPDWLKEEQFESQADMELQSIFAAAEEEDEEAPVEPEPALDTAAEAAPDLEIDPDIDTSDPWVEAFEMERLQGMDDIHTVPDWYAEKLQSAEAPGDAAPVLEESQLEPEEALEPGEAEPVPDWLDTAIDADDLAPADEVAEEDIPDWLRDQVDSDQITVAEEAAEDIPDWLQSAGIEDPESVPDWLMETVADEDVYQAPAAQAEPQPIPQQPAAQVSPAPVPASDIDADAALQTARESVGSGDVTGGLLNYETVVRANAHLDAVIADLSQLIGEEAHSQNAAAYRVLGDGLMRQGRLQEALDTYRRALNLL
jgi:tetratricopeptide (TPR) repeat protein